MLSPSQLEEIPKKFDTIIISMEMDILQDIVARIKKNKAITSTADWEIKRLSEIRGFSTDMKKYIQEAVDLTDKEINRIYDDVVKSDYVRDIELYSYCGKDIVPFEENEELQQLITAVKAQTADEIENITQTTAMNMNINGKTVITPMGQYFRKTLDEALTKVATGTQSYDQVIKQVVAEMAKNDIQTIDYESGARRSTVSATRTAVMTGLSQVTGKINEMNAKELGTDHYEVSYHMGARNKGTGYENHQEWQGKVYPMSQLKSICGLGEAGGLCGCNCRHNYHPFILGVSVRTYTDEQLESMKEKENKKRKFGNKEYDGYEATQKMRSLESLMRKQRKELALLKKTVGTDDEDYILKKAKYQATSQLYTRFAKEMELPQERQRIYGDGAGRV